MAFDEIAGISAAEESVRLDISEAQAEAKRMSNRRVIRRPRSLPHAGPRHRQRLIRKHRRSIRKRRIKKLCFAPRPKAVVRLRLN